MICFSPLKAIKKGSIQSGPLLAALHAKAVFADGFENKPTLAILKTQFAKDLALFPGAEGNETVKSLVTFAWFYLVLVSQPKAYVGPVVASFMKATILRVYDIDVQEIVVRPLRDDFPSPIQGWASSDVDKFVHPFYKFKEEFGLDFTQHLSTVTGGMCIASIYACKI